MSSAVETKGGGAPVTPEEFNKTGKLFAPVNQMANAWGVLGPRFSAVQSANSDTQYSVTWYDVLKEPCCSHDHCRVWRANVRQDRSQASTSDRLAL